MGSEYVSIRINWPTFADGRPLRGPADRADFSAIDARIDALDMKRIEDCVEAETGYSVDQYAVHEAEPPDGLTSAEEEEFFVQAGAAAMRKNLKKAAGDRHGVDFEFDGLRWVASTGGSTYGDSPNDQYDQLRILNESGIFDAPLDAEKFVDVPATAATVAVLDTLANTALRALRGADLPADALARAEAALEAARCDVAGATDTFRKVLDKVTEERIHRAWRWESEAFR